ncbi:sulfatase, partial [Flavihumibacter sediminis]|nr:sulfatase [Flavihumibacter sediminis]
KGDWKLLHAPMQSNPAELDANGLMLVNLQSDPGEKINLAAKFPNKIKELKAAYQEWSIKVAEQ